MSNRCLFLIVIYCIIACTQGSEPCADLKYGENANPVALLYLDERGCLACTRGFAHLCESYLDVSRVNIVMKATGAQLDISTFIKPGEYRVQWDDDGKLAKCLGLIGTSAVFFDKEGAVDTIITMNARTLNQDFNYIISRLPQRPDSLRIH